MLVWYIQSIRANKKLSSEKGGTIGEALLAEVDADLEEARVGRAADVEHAVRGHVRLALVDAAQREAALLETTLRVVPVLREDELDEPREEAHAAEALDDA